MITPPRPGGLAEIKRGWPPRFTSFTYWTSSATRSRGAGLDVEDVATTLNSRPGYQHVIITGRNVEPRLLEVASLVTEMTKIKHPFDLGQKGQRGIDGDRSAARRDRSAGIGPREDHGGDWLDGPRRRRPGGERIQGGAGLHRSGYHALATGRPARNLDPHLCRPTNWSRSSCTAPALHDRPTSR